MNTKLSTLCFSFLLYMCLRGLLVYMSEFVHYIWNFSWPTKQSLSIRSSAQYSECTVRGSLWQAVDQLYAIFVPEQPCERLFAYETENFPRMTTAEPFQFLAPWLSDGQTCGTENMETSAKRESWFSDPLNWIHAGLLYRSTWWTCRPTMSQTQPFNK